MSAILHRDSVRIVATREATLVAPTWWKDAVQSRVENRKTKAPPGVARMSQTELRAKLLAISNVDYHPSEISRCISGEVVLQDLANEISEALGLPPVWWVSISQDEAERFAQQRELTKARIRDTLLRKEIDPQLAALSAGVADIPGPGDVSRHTDPVLPEHGTSPQRKRGRVGGAGTRTPRR